MLAQGYKDLMVWQKAMTLVTDVYSLTKQFPKEETYTLTCQMRRAAISIPSNIAEGKSKNSRKDYTRFIAIARGSLAELETQLMISQNLAYVTNKQIEPLLKNANEIGRMLSALLLKLGAANT